MCPFRTKQDMNCTNHKSVLDTTCMLTVEERVEKGKEWILKASDNHAEKSMISMCLLVLIRIPNAMTRQHEQNMINLNKYVFPSWQINEKEDIVKLTCVFKNWTRYELHIISKLLLTTNVLIPEE